MKNTRYATITAPCQIIAAKCNEYNMSTAQLAKQLGISDDNMDKILKNEVRLSEEICDKLGKVFNTEPFYWEHIEHGYKERVRLYGGAEKQVGLADSIYRLNLSDYTCKMLTENGISTVGQLFSYTLTELRSIPDIGRASIRDFIAVSAETGYKFATKPSVSRRKNKLYYPMNLLDDLKIPFSNDFGFGLIDIPEDIEGSVQYVLCNSPLSKTETLIIEYYYRHNLSATRVATAVGIPEKDVLKELYTIKKILGSDDNLDKLTVGIHKYFESKAERSEQSKTAMKILISNANIAYKLKLSLIQVVHDLYKIPLTTVLPSGLAVKISKKYNYKTLHDLVVSDEDFSSFCIDDEYACIWEQLSPFDEFRASHMPPVSSLK